MSEFDAEYEFCKECSHHGEPNGCNREGGECEAYHIFTNAYEELKEYKNTGVVPSEILTTPEICEIKMLLYELIHYKQLEAVGRPIKLPCKVGDTVYYVTAWNKYAFQRNHEEVVNRIHISESNIIFETRTRNLELSKFGITWFTDKEKWIAVGKTMRKLAHEEVKQVLKEHEENDRD